MGQEGWSWVRRCGHGSGGVVMGHPLSSQFECCGVNGSADWKYGIPNSCCKSCASANFITGVSSLSSSPDLPLCSPSTCIHLTNGFHWVLYFNFIVHRIAPLLLDVILRRRMAYTQWVHASTSSHSVCASVHMLRYVSIWCTLSVLQVGCQTALVDFFKKYLIIVAAIAIAFIVSEVMSPGLDECPVSFKLGSLLKLCMLVLSLKDW